QARTIELPVDGLGAASGTYATLYGGGDTRTATVDGDRLRWTLPPMTTAAVVAAKASGSDASPASSTVPSP
ncbi:MAG: hypothetical protein AAF772_16660, partial [Acidobacteriota bacterium]